MSERYILEDGNPVPCENLMEWARWIETADRRVAFTETDNGNVSTVFLGLDHSFGAPTPILYETLVFGGTLDGECERYTFKEDAERGHVEMVSASKRDSKTQTEL